MPNYAWHDGKKIHDFDTSNFLGTNPFKFCDWELITLFYSALHYVDSYLSKCFGIDTILNHDDRKRYVTSFLPQIKKIYLTLYYLSRDARYSSTIGTTELVSKIILWANKTGSNACALPKLWLPKFKKYW